MLKRPWFAAVLIALPLAACGGSESSDAASVHADGTGTEAHEGTGTATAPAEGDVDGTEAPIPTDTADAPAFTRPYPGSRVVSDVRAPTETGGLLTFQTDDDPGTIIAYYRERAEEAGLTARADITMGDTRQFGADSRQGGELSVSITPQDDLSTVTVTWDGIGG
ncbi:MAG: hypothetical protein J0L52_02930 [Caulobacterales bacterium]|nr:hypothetical protein [Caulobacterales bacterium]